MNDNENQIKTNTTQPLNTGNPDIVSEINSRRIFNLQSSGTKPYNIQSVLKPSSKNDKR